ncbi:MAG: hypothetical protein JWO31_2634 [Phycisphaerales bacterium]|nr:hypothetical protein [Phycisphaerales bacterium]
MKAFVSACACGVILLVVVVAMFGGKTSPPPPPPPARPAPVAVAKSEDQADKLYPVENVKHLSESDRHIVWRKVFRARRQGLKEADEKYPAFAPHGRGGSSDGLKAYSELSGRLADQYEADVLREAGLSKDQGTSISVEASARGWEPPSDAYGVSP